MARELSMVKGVIKSEKEICRKVIDEFVYIRGSFVKGFCNLVNKLTAR